jgi:hypothetical protein
MPNSVEQAIDRTELRRRRQRWTNLGDNILLFAAFSYITWFLLF